MADNDEVLFEVKGQVGLITLNRPQALNALTLNMVRRMNEQLALWADDPMVQVVAVRGGGRAFCSGGDVKAVALAIKSGDPAQMSLARDFFREEYTLNHRIHTYPKPYISLIDGIVMGGGKGISAHGSHCIISENTLFAMPETSIGFFPDVGGGYFLPRCPGQTGTYLALTSTRIGPVDCIYIGFATHYVPAASFAALTDALVATDFGGGDKTDRRKDSHHRVDELVAAFAIEPSGDSLIAPVRPQIDDCFGHDSIEGILTALEAEGGDFAMTTLQAMYGMSPTSLKIALAQIRRGETLHFARVMTMEYRLSQAIVQSHDFYEGIRAALIDKDRQPQWQPSRVSDVSAEAVEAAFAPLGENDLIL